MYYSVCLFLCNGPCTPTEKPQIKENIITVVVVVDVVTVSEEAGATVTAVQPPMDFVELLGVVVVDADDVVVVDDVVDDVIIVDDLN